MIVRLRDGEVDLERHEVRRGGDAVPLTALEAKLLAHLHHHGDRVVDRTEVLEAVWGYSAQSASQAVHVAVRRLRRKLEVDPEDPVHLVTVAGRGWRLVAAVDAAPEDPALLGRTADLQRVRASLGSAGVVTVVGTGGVGKTTLARAAIAGDPRPTFWVDAVDARDEGGLDGAVRAALGDRSIAETGALLASREPAVLVLDNLEQVADGAAARIAAWCVAAPGLTVLGTSRVALGLAGERVVDLSPLAEIDGLRLLQLRARAAASGWSDDDPALPEIVRFLDALPLAIELAAARASLFSPGELLDRLGRGHDVMRGGSPHRHRTLDETVAWSWTLLAPDHQQALAELTVFRGGWTAAAAEAVVGVADPLDALDALVARSLVRRDPGTVRFDLFAAVRAFAAAALPAMLPAAAARHAAWFAEMGTQPRLDALDGPTGAKLRTDAVKEAGNLAAAVRTALAIDRPDHAARAARVLAVLAAANALPEALPTLRSALARPGLDPVDRALLEVNLGVLLLHASDLDGALAALDAAERRTDHPRVAGLVGLTRANVHVRRSALAEAEAAALGGLAGTAGHGLASLDATIVTTLAVIAHERGDRAAALALYARAEDGFRVAGDLRRAAITAGNRAISLGSLGRLEEAQAVLEEVLAELDAGSHDPRAVGQLRVHLAHVLYDRGRVAEARVGLSAALELVRASGDLPLLSTPLAFLAEILLAEGEVDEARVRANEALAVARRSGDRNAQARNLALLARVALAAGDAAQARHLLGESERRAGARPVASVEAELAQAREALGEVAGGKAEPERVRR